jgi:TonB family protein
MQSLPREARRKPYAVLLSVTFHGIIFTCVLLLGALTKNKLVRSDQRVVVAQIEVAGGSHAIKLVLPEMDTAAHTRKPIPDEATAAKTLLPIQHTHPLQKSGGGKPPTPHAGDGAGNASIGNGSDAEDAHPAFPIVSPRPLVTDRSLLPSTEQKIVVDVKVDAAGAIVTERLVKGFGTKLDQIVLDTVKTWRFQPATVNGRPVPTEAEVIIPFGPGYSAADF